MTIRIYRLILATVVRAFFNQKQLSTVLLTATLFAGCATNSGVRWQLAHQGKFVHPQNATLTLDDEAIIADLCAGGMPQHRAGSELGPTEFVVRPGYALEFSNDLKVPLWVCEHVTAAQLTGNEKRADQFKPDPMLKGPKSELEDYKGSGYDRGHQAPAGDQTVDKTLKADTFYLSNMAPQVPAFNQQVWAGVEGLARDWATEYGEVWVITGDLLYDPAEEDAATADGWIKYNVIGTDGVAVPTHFYKIVARREHDAWLAIAFVLENRKYAKPYDFSAYITSIQWVEDRAGIVFMPTLAASDSDSLKGHASALWH